MTGHFPHMLLLFACVLVAQPSLVGQTPAAVIAGQVIDPAGDPVEQVIVRLPDAPRRGALTDSTGRFVIQGVPPGEWVVEAMGIPIDRDLAFVRVEDGDSIEVTLTVSAPRWPLDGRDYPTPGLQTLTTAEGLIPTVLQEATILHFFREHWPDLGPSDTLVVWAFWASDAATLETEAGPTLEIVDDCPACVERPFITVEGGGAYVAGSRHLRLGVRSGGYGTPWIQFCLGLVDPGDVLLRNCVGPPHTHGRVTYWEREPRWWVVGPCSGARDLGC